MSETDEILKQAIIALGKKRKKFTLIVGTVKALEDDTCTVDDYEDVRLNAIIDDLNSQFTIYPKVDSKVVIARLDDSDAMFVIRVSEIEKVTIKIGNQLFEMKDGKFTIKVGSVSLKSILDKGFDQLDKAIITTPSGPGQFSPADKLVFQDLKAKSNQLLS
ncbi:hypothetical protein [Flavobacterium columnare]|uniref:Uncharacterized protein n=1 Tax=Flavobacterium columnare TaxID=996 RepID=A0AAI8CFY7_9FLAO|nr:hypothetical protein [Flavobacterium columnare]AMO19229.1 hypothetical protein UN65_01635 [Flavobacterium columnare]AUX17164.1 hypothetical protein AQ623_01700 [Flavobacterium columnare]QOG56180.1 hypothetical protein HUE29_01650 [Flavobacterium columnare]QOG58903.1 hypothetical protein HUE30_01650 [Flavobacterium columnare]QOG61625.1 hypothetical protein HUE31_01655 [Flavobacterium columnare]